MNVLNFIINRIFRQRKDLHMDQEQNFPEIEKQSPKPSQPVEMKSQADRRKTVENAPAPGEEGAP